MPAGSRHAAETGLSSQAANPRRPEPFHNTPKYLLESGEGSRAYTSQQWWQDGTIPALHMESRKDGVVRALATEVMKIRERKEVEK